MQGLTVLQSHHAWILPDFRDENPVPDTAITLDLTADWLGQCPLAPLAADVRPSAQNLLFEVGSRLHPLVRHRAGGFVERRGLARLARRACPRLFSGVRGPLSLRAEAASHRRSRQRSNLGSGSDDRNGRKRRISGRAAGGGQRLVVTFCFLPCLIDKNSPAAYPTSAIGKMVR